MLQSIVEFIGWTRIQCDMAVAVEAWHSRMLGAMSAIYIALS